MKTDVRVPKHRFILETLRKQIESGEFGPGDRIPTDMELVEFFGASRPTVAKALQELERCGMVRRRPGAGTFVREQFGGRQNFGLLITGLGDTEIFEPICGAMARVAQRSGHALLWGGGAAGSSDIVGPANGYSAAAWKLCQQFIRNRVAGVFFAPVELDEDQDRTNRRIIEALKDVSIPVVLLDRDYVTFPERSEFDLVGIDNRRVGYMVTKHLLERGCKKICFVARTSSANTIEARIYGFKEALVAFGIRSKTSDVRYGDPRDVDFVRNVIDQSKPDGIVCGNDMTAAWLMHSLQEIGVQVPDHVMIIGIDDVKYAGLFRVGLTTVRQPCSAIGDAAFKVMLDRIENLKAPPRDVLLACELVVRQSTTPR